MIDYKLIGLTALSIILLLLVIRYWRVGCIVNSVWVNQLKYYYKRYKLRRWFSKREDRIAWSSLWVSLTHYQKGLDLGSKLYIELVEAYRFAHKSLNSKYQPYFKHRLDIVVPS